MSADVKAAAAVLTVFLSGAVHAETMIANVSLTQAVPPSVLGEWAAGWKGVTVREIGYSGPGGGGIRRIQEGESFDEAATSYVELNRAVRADLKTKDEEARAKGLPGYAYDPNPEVLVNFAAAEGDERDLLALALQPGVAGVHIVGAKPRSKQSTAGTGDRVLPRSGGDNRSGGNPRVLAIVTAWRKTILTKPSGGFGQQCPPAAQGPPGIPPSPSAAQVPRPQ